MDEEPKYASSMGLNVERGIALALVAIWATAAYFIGGPPLAMRAALLFSFPLAFIWLPEVMAKAQASSRHEGFRLEGGVMPAVMKWMGWFMLLGVPAVWGIFGWAFK
jgi:hypothetical protein